MKAVVCNAYGPPEQLVVEEMNAPEVSEGHLLIDIHGAGVNFPDALTIEDKYQFKRKPPFVPGSEVAGIVTAVGEGAEGFSVGDRVFCGSAYPGGFAEQGLVRADGAHRVPEGKDLVQAASFGVAYMTAYYGLVSRGEVKAGETLLVLGASGGVGLAAVEIGKALGARVIAAASTDEKLALCRAHGASDVINYSSENLKERVRELTDGRGADAVYDPVGGDIAEQALRATAWEGRFLVIGFVGGIPKIPLNLALLKSCQIVGVFLGAAIGRDPGLARKLMDDSIALWAQGKIDVPVTKTAPLEGAAELLRDMMDRRVLGKVAVVPAR